jgi:hypothetical protein
MKKWMIWIAVIFCGFRGDHTGSGEPRAPYLRVKWREMRLTVHLSVYWRFKNAWLYTCTLPLGQNAWLAKLVLQFRMNAGISVMHTVLRVSVSFSCVYVCCQCKCTSRTQPHSSQFVPENGGSVFLRNPGIDLGVIKRSILAVTLQTCVRVILSSNISRYTDSRICGCHGFPRFLQADGGIVSWLRHNCILSDPLQFVYHTTIRRTQ